MNMVFTFIWLVVRVDEYKEEEDNCDMFYHGE